MCHYFLPWNLIEVWEAREAVDHSTGYCEMKVRTIMPFGYLKLIGATSPINFLMEFSLNYFL